MKYIFQCALFGNKTSSKTHNGVFGTDYNRSFKERISRMPHLRLALKSLRRRIKKITMTPNWKWLQNVRKRKIE